MCGIVGGIGGRDLTSDLFSGLQRLEYRGYDSAGIAVLDEARSIHRVRAQGKLVNLQQAMEKDPIAGHCAIAHTRWATHGKPSEENAHPHMSGNDFALVHNGIIENYQALRQELTEKGYSFDSETDTEIVVHVLHYEMEKHKDYRKALQATVDLIEGAYAFGIISEEHPSTLVAIRYGSPLVIGLGDGENYLASDYIALSSLTKRFITLDEGDMAFIKQDSVVIYDAQGDEVQRAERVVNIHHEVVDKGPYRHFMLKEINEQAEAVGMTLEGRLGKGRVLEAIFGTQAEAIFDQVEHVQIVACGTSYHAGLVSRYWFESIAKIPCQVEIASEIRYRDGVVQPNSLFIVISQSGETADTLAALRAAKKLGYLACLAICNVPESSIAREADLCFMTRAGVEIGVASTKAFTTQLVALLMLVIALGRRHGLSEREEAHLVQELRNIPSAITRALGLNEAIQKIALGFADKQHALFLGRGTQYPLALEGALKLKEISYIHAEAYPAGELKHGPLALVDERMPVVAVAPNDALLEKLKSNLQEVSARGGKLIVFMDETIKEEANNGTEFLTMPHVHDLIVPIVYTIPMQLLAYHVAVIKGTDIDQPRNLAKSVTVE